MAKLNKFAAAIMLSFGALTVATSAVAADKCPIEKRKNQAVGQSVGKKIQRSYKAYTEGNIDEALAVLLEASAKKDFDKASVARMLGNFYAEKNQLDKAFAQLKEAADLDVLGGTEHADTLKLVGILAVQSEKFNVGISYFKKWLDFTCKQDEDVYRLLAASYSQVKDWDNAIKYADLAIKVAKKPKKDFYNVKVNAYYNKKELKNAVKVLETAVELFPGEGSFWRQLSQFYLATENYKKALYTYDLTYKAGFLTAGSGITRLAQLQARYGGPYHGAKLLEKHLKAGDVKKDKSSLRVIAGLFQNAKDMKKAADYFGQAAAIDNDAKLYLKQGRMLSSVQNYSASIKAYNNAIKAGLANPGEAYYELSLSYLNLKQYKSSLKNILLAKKDKKTKKHATSFEKYIREKARINKVKL
ncbi:tetratricopeptide repeat protein [Parashewanella tropica]|uniref:tetratricopeptide repeat protein n=1 Tax=Parashewanella tropica TaxID=2547970 RepID=UPI00105984B3|nr:tetratricopeptide repeat protein [Parashewanella tropica]